MRPDDANVAGNVHGGTILKMIEEAGAIISTRHCNSQDGVSVCGPLSQPAGIVGGVHTPGARRPSVQRWEGVQRSPGLEPYPPAPPALGASSSSCPVSPGRDSLQWHLVLGSARRDGELPETKPPFSPSPSILGAFQWFPPLAQPYGRIELFLGCFCYMASV